MESYELILRSQTTAGEGNVLTIIAVQGLWANSEYAWSKNGVNWLSDLLPCDLQNARILSFQPRRKVRSPFLRRHGTAQGLLSMAMVLSITTYLVFLQQHWIMALTISIILTLVVSWMDPLYAALINLLNTSPNELSKAAAELSVCLEDVGTTSISTESQATQRPSIVLIGHSFGGLIVKQCISSYPRVDQLSTQLLGVIFTGTPQNGSHLASILYTFVRLLWSDASILPLLTTDSATLAALQESFHVVLRKLSIKVISFYEAKPTYYGFGPFAIPIFTVTQTESLLGTGKSISLDTNHSNLVKFSSRAEPNYRLMLNAIEEIIKQ